MPYDVQSFAYESVPDVTGRIIAGCCYAFVTYITIAKSPRFPKSLERVAP